MLRASQALLKNHEKWCIGYCTHVYRGFERTGHTCPSSSPVPLPLSPLHLPFHARFWTATGGCAAWVPQDACTQLTLQAAWPRS